MTHETYKTDTEQITRLEQLLKSIPPCEDCKDTLTEVSERFGPHDCRCTAPRGWRQQIRDYFKVAGNLKNAC